MTEQNRDQDEFQDTGSRTGSPGEQDGTTGSDGTMGQGTTGMGSMGDQGTMGGESWQDQSGGAGGSGTDSLADEPSGNTWQGEGQQEQTERS